MRLAKHLAHCGVASRRASERIVAEGRVAVAGEVVRDPARDVGPDVRVTVDGREIGGPEARVMYMVHKPVGVLSTVHDPRGRPIVLDLMRWREDRRLYPVGRLDMDSSGLILLTNDGALAHTLTHPRFEVQKTYVVELAGGPIGRAALRTLRDGVELEDGITLPAQVRSCGRSQLEIAIREGRNRQVRRMCAAVGHPVMALRRVRFGPLELGELGEGEHRVLSDAEVASLRDAAGGEAPADAAMTDSDPLL